MNINISRLGNSGYFMEGRGNVARRKEMVFKIDEKGKGG